MTKDSTPVPPRVSQCLRHAGRPAVARCLECGGAYCRECVVEHGQRLVCADCLRRVREAGEVRSDRWRLAGVVVGSLQWVMAAGVLWLVFYGVGELLRRIPAEVHDGVIWQVPANPS